MPDPIQIDPSRKPDAVIFHRNARQSLRGDEIARTAQLLDQAAKFMGEPNRSTLCYSKQFGDEWYYIRRTADHAADHSLYFPVDHPERDPLDPSKYINVKANDNTFLMYLKDTAIAMHQEAADARKATPKFPMTLASTGETDA